MFDFSCVLRAAAWRLFFFFFTAEGVFIYFQTQMFVVVVPAVVPEGNRWSSGGILSAVTWTVSSVQGCKVTAEPQRAAASLCAQESALKPGPLWAAGTAKKCADFHWIGFKHVVCTSLHKLWHFFKFSQFIIEYIFVSSHLVSQKHAKVVFLWLLETKLWRIWFRFQVHLGKRIYFKIPATPEWGSVCLRRNQNPVCIGSKQQDGFSPLPSAALVPAKM